MYRKKFKKRKSFKRKKKSFGKSRSKKLGYPTLKLGGYWQ